MSGDAEQSKKYWVDKYYEAEAEVERLRLELLKSQTENERLKRVEESAKKLLDSCLEGESENGDEIDYIEQLRAENKKLKQDIRQFYFDHGVLLKENERLKAVAEAAREFISSTGCNPKECGKCDPKYIGFCRWSGIGQALSELDEEGER